MSKKQVLILSSDTGGGHRSAETAKLAAADRIAEIIADRLGVAKQLAEQARRS